MATKQSTINLSWSLDTSNLEKARSATNSLKSAFESLESPLKGTNSQLKCTFEILSNIHDRYKRVNDIGKNVVDTNKGITSSFIGIIDKSKESIGQFKNINDNAKAFRSSINDSNDSFKKFNHSTHQSVINTQQLRQSIKDLDSVHPNITPKMDKGSIGGGSKMHLFGGVAAGTIAGNALANTFSALTGKIKEGLAAGIQYDKEQQKMNATWTTLTGSAGKAQDMVSTVNDLSVKTGQAAGTVDELEQSFYHLHSSKTESDELTKSMLNMADAVGLGTPQIQAVSQDMVNGLSRGKANAGILNQISQYFPMFREQLAQYETQVHHGKKVTVSDLMEMSKKGQISASDIEKVFNSLGSGKYSKAAENMLKTMFGMERTIKARVPVLIGAFEKPFMTAKNPIYGAISKWVSDKKTEKEFTKMGQATNQGIITISNAFAKAYNVKNGANTMDHATDVIANGITKMSNAIARNAPAIKDFFSFTKSSGVLTFKLLAETIKDVSKIALPFLQFAVKHQKIIVPLLAGMFVTKKALGFASALKSVAKSIGLVTAAEKLNNKNSLLNGILGNGTVTGKIANKPSKNKAFSTAFDLKGSSIGSNFSKSSLGTMKSKPSNGMFRAPGEIGAVGKYSSLRNFGNKLRPSSIGRGIAASHLGRGTSFLGRKLGITSLFGKIPNPKNGIKAIGNGTKSIGRKVVGSRFVPQILKNGALPKVGSKLLGGAKAIGSKIPYLDVAMAGTQLIGMNKKNAGGKIGSAGGMLAGTTGGAATGAAIGSVIPGLGTGIGGLIGGAAGGIGGSSIGKKIGKTIQKSLPKDAFNPIVKQWNKFKNWIGKSVHQVVKPFTSLFSGIGKLFKPVTNGWNSFQKALNTKKGQANVKMLSHVFKIAITPLKGLFNGIKVAFKVSMSVIKATARGIGSFLYTLFKGVFKTVGGIFKIGADLISGKWSNLGKDLKEIGSGIWDIIRSPFAGIGRFFGSLWVDIKHQASQGFKWVKGIVAGGINDLFWIINTGSKLINKVLSYVGGSGHTIGMLKPVHFATGTRRKKINRPTYSMLNDGNDSPETGNKEMAILPTGHAFMPKQRNWKGVLPAGTEVMNAKETKNIMNMNGIEHFAGGTGFFGNMLNGAKNMAGSATHAVTSGIGHVTHGAEKAGKWAWDKAKDVGSAIAHPIRTIMNAFGRLPKLPPFLTDFGNGVLDKVKTMAVDFFKQNGGGSANPGGAGVQRWKPDVAKALRMLNLSTSGGMINKVLTQINTESGGNPNAVGGTDGLADGRAMGLMQVKPGTFSAYSKPGLGGWSNGFASIFSGLNYAKHRYGPDLSFLGQGHGYATGGTPLTNHSVLVGENGPEIAEFKSPTQIHSHNASKAIAAKMNHGKNININPKINITINGSASKEDAKESANNVKEQILKIMSEVLGEAELDQAFNH
ncbi:tape measure protein [Apilactobacillus micheneri]|uniref:tape measure protein n=1 Tax=Apilactobacillus micheneri TaxID=1899430 RepID=UPI001129E737|nr:tape measure protein [Apilactobacillus micheneri]TPR40401.1 hypothetical protein DY119_01555 [Apilactobacillus micheneri]